MASVDFDITNIAERALEIRDSLRKQTPERWPPMLEAAEDVCLQHFGFKTLAEFVTTSVNSNGLGMTLDQAREMISFNKGYKHKAPALLKKLGIAEVAKGVDPLNENGIKNSFDKTDNIKANEGGTGKNYRIAKLKRDHPEIAKRLELGEFKNVADAERAAGTRPPKREELGRFVCYEDEPLLMAHQILEKLEPKHAQAIGEHIVKWYKSQN